MKNKFKNADKAFRYYKNYIKDYGNWTVEITMNGKRNTDPNKYKKESIMHKVYEYCDYYYNKYKKDGE